MGLRVLSSSEAPIKSEGGVSSSLVELGSAARMIADSSRFFVEPGEIVGARSARRQLLVARRELLAARATSEARSDRQSSEERGQSACAKKPSTVGSVGHEHF